ncbi:MAG: hypothetical protein J0I48_06210, partial [Devosia sp.]|nr:hypothetical protein [Devosia sp.]
GGRNKVLALAKEAQRKKECAWALELAGYLWRLDPNDVELRQLKADLLRTAAQHTTSMIARSFSLSAVLAQMVPLLTAVGLGASALLVSTLFGPAQVLVRFANLLAGAARHPVFPALLALALLPAAIAVLAFGAPALVAAVLFAVMLGFGSGLKSIVHGSLPLALFGPDAYGARLGLMASVRQVLASVAPFVLATLIEAVGVRPALWLVAGVGLLGLACLVQVARSVRPAH